MTRAAWLALLVLPYAGALPAQEGAPIRPGARMAITTPGARIVGDLVSARGDTLVLEAPRYPGGVRIPLGDIREAEVSLGRRSAAGQGVTGFVVGAVAAGGGMAIACALTADCPVALLTVGAGGLGGLLGAAVGASRGTDSSRECWRTITPELRGWLSGEVVDAPPRRSLSPFARRAEPVARPATRCD